MAAVSLPEGVALPAGAEFGKQYLNIGNSYKPRESSLFLLALKAQQVVDEQELLDARLQLGLGDTGRDNITRLDFVKVPTYNYFFYEHDVSRATTVVAAETIQAAAQVSGGLPIDFNVALTSEQPLQPGYVILNKTTLIRYLVRRTDHETANTVRLRAILGGTYSAVTNFPPTFTNATSSSILTSGDVFLILGSIVQHGASEAIEFEPADVNVRQGRVQSTYEKYSKTLQALMVEGSNLTRTTDYRARMAQFTLDMLERAEKTLLWSKGDYQTIDSGNYYFTDGLLDQIGTTVAASALDGTPVVPSYDAFDDIIERISQTGGNYVLAVGRTMRRFCNKVLRSTTLAGSTYRINKSESDTTIGSNLLEIVGTFGGVPIVYYPGMNDTTALAESIMAINVDNIMLTTVSNQASVDLNNMRISGDGMLKTKMDLQDNEQLIKADGIILDYGLSLVHPTTHYLFTGFTSVIA